MATSAISLHHSSKHSSSAPRRARFITLTKFILCKTSFWFSSPPNNQPHPITGDLITQPINSFCLNLKQLKVSFCPIKWQVITWPPAYHREVRWQEYWALIGLRGTSKPIKSWLLQIYVTLPSPQPIRSKYWPCVISKPIRISACAQVDLRGSSCTNHIPVQSS